MIFIEKSITAKLVGIALLVMACLALPSYFIFQSAKKMVVDELNKNAINIAAVVSSAIERDIDAYINLPSGSNTDTDSFDEAYYNELLAFFEKITNETGAANIYTEKRSEDPDRALIFDKAPLQQPGTPPQEGPPPPVSRELTEEELQAFNEGTFTKSGLLQDSTRGEFIVGYAPIFDSRTGKPVGIIGVEFSFSYADNITNRIKTSIFAAFFVIMILTTFVVYSLVKSRRKYLVEDFMTGLVTKRYFEKRLKWMIHHARKTEKKLSLIMIDVDYFKMINDTLGHASGDKVIKDVAQHIQKNIRHNDLCCRFGGDEFVAALLEIDKTKAYEIAERIRHDVKTLKYSADNGQDVELSLSVGIAELGTNQNAEDLIDQADKAMYVSKNIGKDKVTVSGDNDAPSSLSPECDDVPPEAGTDSTEMQ